MTNTAKPREIGSLKIAEGISGVWFYHLSRDEHSIRGLCGARTMCTGAPLTTWGHKGHLNERYCAECERLSAGAVRSTQ